MLKQELIKDVSNICLSYLSQEEQIYIGGEWNKFDKNEVCNIAAESGWLDLLKWARQNGCMCGGGFHKEFWKFFY